MDYIKLIQKYYFSRILLFLSTTVTYQLQRLDLREDDAIACLSDDKIKLKLAVGDTNVFAD
jgi:hypothetical protein